MAIMDVDDSSLPADSKGQVGWLGLRVGGHLALTLHSPNELGELLQWPRHDESNINNVITFCVSSRRRKMYCGHARLYVLSLIHISEPTRPY